MPEPPASRLQFTVSREIPAAAPRLFDVLTSVEEMRRWIPLCRDVRWRHPPGRSALGPGSVRHVLLAWGFYADERITAWEAGRELHYVFAASNTPFAKPTRNYVGVMRVAPLAKGRSRLLWSIHFDTPGLLALSAPPVRMGLRRFIGRMADNISRVAIDPQR